MLLLWGQTSKVDYNCVFHTSQSVMNTTTALVPISDALLAAPYQLNIWLGTFFWIIGNIGCIGNMIVFRSRAFRDRSYSIYLSLQALSDFFYFNFVLVTRILQRGYQIPITARFDAICKIRQFMSFFGNQISFALFTFATIDRLLSAQRSNSKSSLITSILYHPCRSMHRVSSVE
jgi:hypothetical protein